MDVEALTARHTALVVVGVLHSLPCGEPWWLVHARTRLSDEFEYWRSCLVPLLCHVVDFNLLWCAVFGLGWYL